MATLPSAVQRTIDIEADPDDVWELIVDDDERSAWFGGPSTLEPVPGGSGVFTEPDGTRRSAVVEEVEPGRRLRWSWWPDDDPGDAATVDIDLVPVTPERPGAPAIGTRVTVTETPLVPTAACSAAKASMTARMTTRMAAPLLGLELAAMARLGAPAVVASHLARG